MTIHQGSIGAGSAGSDTTAIHKNIANEISTITEKTALADADISIIEDSLASGVKKKFTLSNLKVFLKTYFDGIYSTITTVLGKKNYHGIEAFGALSFNNSTHILTIASGTNTYWYKGTKYTTSSAITCDIDTSNTLTDNTLYFFYFDDASGTLKCSDTFWNLFDKVPVATVYWNGSAGALSRETHGYDRSVDWHIWAHLTIGARYVSGLDLTLPTTTTDGSLQIETGDIYDEDLNYTTGQQTTMRGWFKASANKYTWLDYSLPYLGTAGAPYFLDTDDYVLKALATAKFGCFWVYASTDQDRPIYIVPTHASTGYNTVALARAETPPSLSGLGLTPELKLIYRFIYKADGQFQESTDYRLTQPLPSGGSANTTAGAVVFTPSGNISSTNVQSALQELDTEKEAIWNYSLITLDVAGWSSFEQTETVTGMTSTSDVELFAPSGDDAGLLVGNTAQVRVSARGTDSVTIKCTTVPTDTITDAIIRWR